MRQVVPGSPETGNGPQLGLGEKLAALKVAARDKSPVSGLTHKHYKYPARFSPTFVRAAIEAFSEPGDLVLDPYMGGGTTIVEALFAGRRAVGCDLNSLAVFVAQAKTLRLTEGAEHEVESWALNVLRFGYHDENEDIQGIFCEKRTRNLDLPRSRALKKFLGFALASCDEIRSPNARQFARCVLLNVSQWALNGRRKPARLGEFRERLLDRTFSMLDAARSLPPGAYRPALIHDSAEHLPLREPFTSGGKAALVVTSPPYPGIHILYHRWQVDGRRETPAPYWIANCLDGLGSCHYNFGSRFQTGHEDYFDASLRTLRAIHKVTQKGGKVVQMVAFSDASAQLSRYLKNMEAAGFEELRDENERASRIWRAVPRRNWHADLKGRTGGSREVVLIHVAK